MALIKVFGGKELILLNEVLAVLALPTLTLPAPALLSTFVIVFC